MRKKKPEPAAEGDVPMWFMTYSDVITLMMTFFILLLTFATSEPERFEQMQVSLFGASGANGVVGQRPEGSEKESWVMRVRPKSSRLTDAGSETPPTDREADTQSVDKGLASLKDEDERQVVDSMAFTVPGSSISSVNGELFDYGTHYLKVLARILNNRAYELTVEISSPGQLERAIACIQHLYHVQQIRPDRLIVCRDKFDNLPSDKIRFQLNYYKLKNNEQARTEAAQ